MTIAEIIGRATAENRQLVCVFAGHAAFKKIEAEVSGVSESVWPGGMMVSGVHIIKSAHLQPNAIWPEFSEPLPTIESLVETLRKVTTA